MPVNATILDQLMEERKALEAIINEKVRELDRINEAITLLNGGPATRYNWTERAVECIKGHGRFLRTTDILECVLHDSPELLDPKKKRQATVGLSVALNTLCEKGLLRKIVLKGVKGHFYGLPEWTQEDGNPRMEHIANLMVHFGQVVEPVKLDSKRITQLAGAGVI